MKTANLINVLIISLLCMISLSGCNSKKKNSSDKLQPQTDYYSCNIINKYTDITPASIYPVINDENIVMNGYQNLPVSEICRLKR